MFILHLISLLDFFLPKENSRNNHTFQVLVSSSPYSLKWLFHTSPICSDLQHLNIIPQFPTFLKIKIKQNYLISFQYLFQLTCLCNLPFFSLQVNGLILLLSQDNFPVHWLSSPLSCAKSLLLTLFPFYLHHNCPFIVSYSYQHPILVGYLPY